MSTLVLFYEDLIDLLNIKKYLPNVLEDIYKLWEIKEKDPDQFYEVVKELYVFWQAYSQLESRLACFPEKTRFRRN